MKKIKTVIFASGRGENARKILMRGRSGELPGIEIVAIVSDVNNSGALEVAREFGVKGIYLDPMRKGARFSEEGARFYLENLQFLCADFVVLAGFMRIIPDNILEAYRQRIINLHPSLLPAFKGCRDAITDAWNYGVKVSGCTVHFVNGELDGGKIIAQKAVEREPRDTFETFSEKIHAAEHMLLPQVVADFGAGIIPLGVE